MAKGNKMHQLLQLTCLPDSQKSDAIAHRTNAVSVPEFLRSDPEDLEDPANLALTFHRQPVWTKQYVYK